jgi:hypothetical protein
VVGKHEGGGHPQPRGCRTVHPELAFFEPSLNGRRPVGSEGAEGARALSRLVADHRRLQLRCSSHLAHGLNRRGRPVYFDLRRARAPEKVEQQLARRSDDAGGGFAWPCPDGLGRPLPLKLESGTLQPPCEKPPRLADIAPQGFVHRMLVRARSTIVGSTYVLVVDEELVEVRETAHPSDAKEARRWSRSDCRNKPGETPRRECPSSLFGEAAPCAGQHEPGCGEMVVLAQDEVRGEIAGRPRGQEGWCLGAQFFEQVAELCSLDGVEERIGHIARA